MKSSAKQSEINTARRRAALMQVFDNLRGELSIAQGRLTRAKNARDRGDSVLGANVEGLEAEIVRLLAAIDTHIAHHNLAA